MQSTPTEAKAALSAQGFSANAADQSEALARWLSTSPLASTAVAPVAVQPTTIEAWRANASPLFSRREQWKPPEQQIAR